MDWFWVDPSFECVPGGYEQVREHHHFRSHQRSECWLEFGEPLGRVRSGTLAPLASVAGFTAPMCRSTACTPARPYSEKSSEVIFAGISSTLSDPRFWRSASTR